MATKKPKVKKQAVRSAKKAPAPAARKATGSAVDRLIGKPLPRFELPDQDGAPVSSSELAGKPFVLYFYPKDDTPGCTREACDFRDGLGAFRRAKTRVLGVSADGAESHTRFREKYSLPFTLLSDRDRRLAKALGVWALKTNYGKQTMGIVRSTFLVDAAGVVRGVWRGVKVDGHAAAVLQAVKSLS